MALTGPPNAHAGSGDAALVAVPASCARRTTQVGDGVHTYTDPSALLSDREAAATTAVRAKLPPTATAVASKTPSRCPNDCATGRVGGGTVMFAMTPSGSVSEGSKHHHAPSAQAARKLPVRRPSHQKRLSVPRQSSGPRRRSDCAHCSAETLAAGPGASGGSLGTHIALSDKKRLRRPRRHGPHGHRANQGGHDRAHY